jgi:hypothetical protein
MLAIFEDFWGENSPRLSTVTDYSFSVIAFPLSLCVTIVFWIEKALAFEGFPQDLDINIFRYI